MRAKVTKTLLFKLCLGVSIARGPFEALGNFDALRFWVLVDLLFFIVVRLAGMSLDLLQFHILCVSDLHVFSLLKSMA